MVLRELHEQHILMLSVPVLTVIVILLLCSGIVLVSLRDITCQILGGICILCGFAGVVAIVQKVM